MGQPPTVTGYIESPVNPQHVAKTDDIDSLITLYEELKRVSGEVRDAMYWIRQALLDQTDGDKVTRRVRGRQRQAVLRLPAVSFEQSILKEAWNSYPDYALGMLRVASLSVVMNEYNKLKEAVIDDPSFSTFVSMIDSANRGRVGQPVVTIER